MDDPRSDASARDPARKILPHARPGPNEAVEWEIRHHLEERVERLIEQGLAPEDARREAEHRFGDVDRIRDEVRAVDRRARVVWRIAAMADGIVRDLRIAVRSVLRSPWPSLTVVVTLGLAIGANTAIFSLVEAVILRPPQYPDPNGLAYVTEITPRGRPFAVAPANFLDWKRRQSVFEAMGAVANDAALVTEGGPPERVTGARVSADYFRVLGVDPAMGRVFTAEENGPHAPRVVVVSHSFWVSRLGGDPAAIGRSVRLDGDPYTVIGVMPRHVLAYWNTASTSPIEVWRPDPFANDAATERRAKRLSVIARLEPGVSAEKADSVMKALASGLASEHPDTNEGWSAAVYPLIAAMTEGVRKPLFVLFGAVAVVLLIACLNVGSLLLARADGRRAAITLRRALGAHRALIVRQLLAESLILSLGAAVLGIAIAMALLPMLVATSPFYVTRMGPVRVNEAVLVFSLGLAVSVAFIVGIAPAIGVSAPDLTKELKERGFGKTESRRARRGRSALVIAEVSLSVVLLIGAGLLLSSYVRLSQLELGFEAKHVVQASVTLPRDRYARPAGKGSHPQTRSFTLWRPRPKEIAFVEDARTAMARLPEVEAAAVGNFSPMSGPVWAFPMRVEGDPPPAKLEDAHWAAIRPVSPAWFETLRIPIVRGRPFRKTDGTDPGNVVVLDEKAVDELWPGQDPIGRSVLLRDGEEDVERAFRVIGVAKPVRLTIFDTSGRVTEEILPTAYLPYRRQAEAYVDWQVAFRMRDVFLVRTDRDLGEIAPALRRVVASFDPELPVTVERLTDMVASPLGGRRFYMGVLVAFGLLATVLAASGIFAVMAYSVSRKTRELGIRLALGARRSQLRRAELIRGARLVFLGLVIGVIGAVWLTRFITTFLYGVDAVDPITYASVTALIVLVVLAAAYIPARRASEVDPMESLRTE